MFSFSQALQRLSSAMQGAETCAMNGLDVYHQIKSPLSLEDSSCQPPEFAKWVVSHDPIDDT